MLIDDRYDAFDVCADLRNESGRLEHLAAGRGDVLDEQHAVAVGQRTFVGLGSAVVLLGVSDDDKRLSGCKRRGARVERIVCVIDRQEGARENIEGEGLAFESLFRKEDLGISA